MDKNRKLSMELNTSITPKKSIGGIYIGEHISAVAARLSNSNHRIKPNSTAFDGGLITAYHDAAGVIYSISCNSNFKGNYSNKIWAGMTVGDVLQNTSTQIAWSGFVQVDKIEGIGLLLPDDQDDFERLDDELDHNHVFDELWVYE
jgi:hypothetical protein